MSNNKNIPSGEEEEMVCPHCSKSTSFFVSKRMMYFHEKDWDNIDQQVRRIIRWGPVFLAFCQDGIRVGLKKGLRQKEE